MWATDTWDRYGYDADRSQHAGLPAADQIVTVTARQETFVDLVLAR